MDRSRHHHAAFLFRAISRIVAAAAAIATQDSLIQCESRRQTSKTRAVANDAFTRAAASRRTNVIGPTPLYEEWGGTFKKGDMKEDFFIKLS